MYKISIGSTSNALKRYKGKNVDVIDGRPRLYMSYFTTRLMVCRSPTDRKNASVGLKSEWSWNMKNLRLTFHSSIELFLFLDLDCQNLAALGFDNCPISENEKFSLGMKSSPSIFPIPGHSLSSPTEHTATKVHSGRGGFPCFAFWSVQPKK